MRKKLFSILTALLLISGLLDGLVNLNQTAFAAETTRAVGQMSDNIIATGLKYKGTPYIFGTRPGQTKSFDCSTFTQYIFGRYGIDLPRTSRQQATLGETVLSKGKLQKGDLLFFKTGIRADGKIDHVGVYMGRGLILHSIPDGGVQVSEFEGFWANTFVGGKRVL